MSHSKIGNIKIDFRVSYLIVPKLFNYLNPVVAKRDSTLPQELKE